MARRGLIGRIQAVLTPDLLTPQYRATLRPGDHPVTGHCAVAAEALYHLLGGKKSGLTPMVARIPGGETHWWLRGPDGEIMDPTAEQFGSRSLPAIYASGHGCGFQSPRGISKRAEEVIRRMGML